MNPLNTMVPTVADLVEHLGGIPPHRILLRPQPGTATEEDLAALMAKQERSYELVDGTLVEKAVGFLESYLAMRLGHLLQSFLDENNLGIVAGPDGIVRLQFGLVRIPDVAFVSWRHLPGRQIPTDPIPDLAPDLAVEVISKGNTAEEMDRKLREYFDAGVELVWYVYPEQRTVHVYRSADSSAVMDEDQTLDGGDVLPGFRLPIRELFAQANSGKSQE